MKSNFDNKNINLHSYAKIVIFIANLIIIKCLKNDGFVIS